MDENKIIIKDRELLKLIEVFMGYADGYLSEIITWNDLMPVVERICKTDMKYMFDFNICVDLTEVRISEETTLPNESGRDFEMIANTVKVNNPLEAVWLAVVEFIKWYNEYRTFKTKN